MRHLRRRDVFPKVDAASPRGLMALSGLRPSAPRVLSGTGWRLPDGFRAFGPGSYIIPLRWRGTAPAAPVYMPPAGGESRTAAKRHTKWRPQGAFLSPAQRCFITPEGASPQPACKAQPITGRTLPAQGVSPAAGSTLARESGRQPSGIQVSAEPRKSAATFRAPHMI